MNAPLPAYYTTLKPFAGLFAGGLPVLMYHKLGPRPARVRLKGLYVGSRLFARQLAELKQAGFATAAYGLPEHGSNVCKQVTLTFDDGFANALRHGLEPLARHGF